MRKAYRPNKIPFLTIDTFYRWTGTAMTHFSLCSMVGSIYRLLRYWGCFQYGEQPITFTVTVNTKCEAKRRTKKVRCWLGVTTRQIRYECWPNKEEEELLQYVVFGRKTDEKTRGLSLPRLKCWARCPVWISILWLLCSLTAHMAPKNRVGALHVIYKCYKGVWLTTFRGCPVRSQLLRPNLNLKVIAIWLLVCVQD